MARHRRRTAQKTMPWDNVEHSCSNCGNNFGIYCVGDNPNKCNGPLSSPNSPKLISETEKMYPDGCESWSISFELLSKSIKELPG